MPVAVNATEAQRLEQQNPGVSESLKPAANIDLKDVVSEPLLPSVTAVEPAATVAPEVNSNADALPVEIPASTAEPVSSMTIEPKTETLKTELTQPPLILLHSEVLPGTTTRLAWTPSVSFMGISAPTAVLVINGVKPGPTLCLTAAIHGDELNGIEIVRRVLYNIEPQELSGAIIGVPIVNLQGFRAGSRYLTDRRDLNRFFPGHPQGSSASRIAYSFFNEVVRHCDMLIDLHTGSFRRTNLPQLRADLNYPAVKELSRKMGAIVVVQSVGGERTLRRAATESGIPAVTLEAGAPHELQKDAVEYGVKSVESALDGLGLIDRHSFWQRVDEPVYYKSTWVRSSEGGILFSEVELGQSVDEGELLGAVTDPITNQRHEIRSTYRGRIIGMALNQVMHSGFAAYHIGIEASVMDVMDELESNEGADSEANNNTEFAEPGDVSDE
ncbi:MAG: putative deacylase [Halioglobus sp.]|jgi:predicted deacylase